MQNSQLVAERIKSRIKELGKSVKVTLSDLGMGINTISELSKGKEISYARLADIAEYLNCSVDYLLGRVDNPQGIIKSEPTIDPLDEKILELFAQLTPENKEKFLGRLVQTIAAQDKK